MLFLCDKIHSMLKIEKLQKYSAIKPSESVLFEKFLMIQLEEYEDVANEIINDYSFNKKDLILKDISSANIAINETVRLALQGKHSYAFMKLLEYVQHHIPRVCHESSGSSYYRMRAFEDKRKCDINELFHIPFDKQGQVKTQRYSTPGLPCLYLGTSLLGCWEELGQPALYSCMFSRLVNTADIELWDLRIPESIDDENDLKILLTTMPLIVACSIKVKNPDDSFKPEYIIPQYLLESLLISKELKNTISVIGIKYRSVIDNKDFNFPSSKYDNIAIPAIRGTYKHDDRLCKLFKITQPTCEEYEKIRYHKIIVGSDITHEDSFTYKNSLFGELESFLSDTETFPLLNIENKHLKNDYYSRA